MWPFLKNTYAPLMMQSAQMPSPDAHWRKRAKSAEQFAHRCANALETYIAAHHDELAAFIVEPMVQCAAGMGMYRPLYLKRAREICSQYQVHLIADKLPWGLAAPAPCLPASMRVSR